MRGSSRDDPCPGLIERGNIVFGGAAERVTVDLDPGHATADPMQLRAVARLLPAIAKVAVIRTWSGCEGHVRDMLPVMGRSATTPGLFHASVSAGTASSSVRAWATPWPNSW